MSMAGATTDQLLETLAKIEKRFDDVDQRQREIAKHLAEMNGTIRDVIIEIGGVPGEIGRDPDRHSIRRRVHDLENVGNAAGAAGAALGLLFGRTTKFLLLGAAGITALIAILRFFGLGG